MKKYGTKVEVYNGVARYTKGGHLSKRHLVRNKWGRVVSKKKSQLGKRSQGFRALVSGGFVGKKRRRSSKRKSSSKRRKGRRARSASSSRSRSSSR